MSNERNRLEFWLDLIIPAGAVLVICFSLGSLFYDGHFRIASNRSQEILKAYRQNAAAIPPW